jgi:ATP-dependent DNA helicase RecQ
MNATETRDRAIDLLHQMLGSRTTFRDGQLESILAVVQRRQRVLVVQRTGWGKSLVYFISTKLLRERQAGLTLLVSPLLSLMRNQIEMAERIGIRAVTINSANTAEWAAAEAAIAEDRCDVLLISPERLSNASFLQRILPRMQGRIGLFVVDEVHCISDWGHDFRPDYRRIVRIVRALPASVPIMGTTATANDRVIADIKDQFEGDLAIIRGPLARASLRLQTIKLADQSERLAWLSKHVPSFPGSGIIYCLTVADVRRVAAWLQSSGVDAAPYYAGLDTAQKVTAEQRLLRNELKVLVATVALGMGFDKPDLGFVVHYQRPGSVIAYYQQVGRAGRAVADAFAILLNGREDDEIQDYFIESAFPQPAQMQEIVDLLEASDSGLTQREILDKSNLSFGTVERALKLLEVDGAVTRQEGVVIRTLNPWLLDADRISRVTAQRRQEVQQMRDFTEHPGCLMEFISRALDDPAAARCGRCANCAGDLVPRAVLPQTVLRAVAFLRRDTQMIEPRKQWPLVPRDARTRIIPAEQRMEAGRALCIYGDAGWGHAVKLGKYTEGRFSQELVEASAALIRDRWKPVPYPTWITCIPSLRRPDLVPDFARRLADALELPHRPVLRKTFDTPPQGEMQNSVQQARNVFRGMRVAGDCPSGPVLLIDDVVDSRWTLTVTASRLRQAGVAAVIPFVLAIATGATGDSL